MMRKIKIRLAGIDREERNVSPVNTRIQPLSKPLPVRLWGQLITRLIVVLEPDVVRRVSEYHLGMWQRRQHLEAIAVDDLVYR